MKSYKDIEYMAQKLDRNLLANDKRLNGAVKISHRDGSIFLFNNAFYITKSKWIIVLSEHHGYHVYHKEDLYNYEKIDREDIYLED